MIPCTMPSENDSTHMQGSCRIVVISSIVVAGTAAAISKRFDSFSYIGGIIGSSVSAAFLLILGSVNAYILFLLVRQLRKLLLLSPAQRDTEEFKIQGGGCLFFVLKKLFKLVDRYVLDFAGLVPLSRFEICVASSLLSERQ